MNNGDLIVLDGCTFMYSDVSGDAEADEAKGFFYRDVRHLSSWHVFVDGKAIEPLSSRRVDYYSARIVGGDEKLAVRRDRFVSEGMHEDVVVQNLSAKPCDVRVEVAYGSDFADVMEAQQGGNGAGRTWMDAKARSVTLWHERDGYRRGTTLTFNRRGAIDGKRARFRVRLAPRESWSLSIDITPVVDGKRWPPLLRTGSFHDHAPKMPVSLDEWLEQTPELVTEHDALERTYRQSNLDLAALRIRPDSVTIGHSMPGGGLPWFMTAFGRDSLITAYQALPFHADMARAALEALAEMQATEGDAWRDAEPGKIPHELRRGVLAALGEIPHTPYYGSHDSTLWWLIVLDEYHRWSGDDAFVRRLEPNARAALAWLEGAADLDGDGYLEYRKRSDSEVALDNQCWKDSHDMPPTHTDEGLRAAGEIRSRYAETAVLVLSQHLELEYVLRLIDQKPEGVGYLMKERVGRVEQLLDAVHRVAAGECVVDSAIVEELLARRRQVDPLEELTPREREVIALMAEGRSNQGICRTLWLSPKTVETHIRGAFAKLGINEAPEDNRRVLAVLAYLGR